MRYWKRINPDGSTQTVESYSHSLGVKGAVEIAKEEFDEFISSLPVVEPELVRNPLVEIDDIRAKLKEKGIL